MDRLSLRAQEREIFGKKVKKLRKQGLIPGHVFGNSKEVEHVSVALADFLPVFHKAGETGLIDLKIGAEKVKPVMVRGRQVDPVKGALLHIDFYQVNLSEKVKVPVPIVIVGGEDLESVKIGENVILQTLAEVEVEALPTDLIEKIEVDVRHFKNVDDAVTVEGLDYDRSKLTITERPEEIVVKLAPAITEEMKKLMEEEALEQAAAQAAATEEGVEAPAEGEGGEVVEGEAAGAEAPGEPKEGGEEAREEAPKEESQK